MRNILVLAVVLAAGSGGYWAGRREIALPVPLPPGVSPEPRQSPAPSGQIIYYRDPDGRAFYSGAPRKTPDGRDYHPVRASEDTRFEEEPTGGSQTDARAGTRRVLHYRNPMGLPDTSPTPKKDSMGMDYVPVYEGEDGSAIIIPTGKRQRTGVRTGIAAERIIIDPLRLPGVIQLDERRIVAVATRADAFIDKVADVTTGSRVTAGQSLLQFYAPDIAAAGAQFLTELNNGGTNGLRGGARQRLANLGVPPETIAEMERSRQVPLSMTWRAPRDGIVLQRDVMEGMKAPSGSVLFKLGDLSIVWVIANVPEYRLGSVQVGAPARVRPRSLPGRVFSGRVALVYPELAAETRTARVRIEIANPDGALLPEMYADVEIPAGDASPVLAVPDDAIIDSGTRQVVILDSGDGRFEPRQVAIGQKGGGFTEIRDGLRSGDRVVVAANFLIDAESNLRAALNSMTEGEAAP